jgi:hypothetical protein
VYWYVVGLDLTAVDLYQYFASRKMTRAKIKTQTGNSPGLKYGLRSLSCPSSFFPGGRRQLASCLPAAAGPIVARQAHGSRSFFDLCAPDGPTNSRREPLCVLLPGSLLPGDCNAP